MNNDCYNHFSNNCCRSRTCCCNNYIHVPGPQGPAGNSATVAVGATTTGAPGTNASVTNSGTTNNAVLNFVIPRGEPGINGTSSTIEIGTTTTLPEGSNATVTNVGTPTNAILNFGIPRGAPAIIDSGNFISRSSATYTNANSIIELPIILNSNGITINNNSVISVSKPGRYIINYGIKSTTIGNIVGIYINGINNTNTNIETAMNNLNTSVSIILNLNSNDIITLGAVNASNENPLTLQQNTINSYLTIISLD